MPSRADLMLRALAERVSKHARHRCSLSFHCLVLDSAIMGDCPLFSLLPLSAWLCICLTFDLQISDLSSFHAYLLCYPFVSIIILILRFYCLVEVYY
jgi:hypothetical protein